MFQLSQDGLAFVKKEMARYEERRSAIIPALYCAQAENGGWVSSDVVDHLSKVMDIPPAHIEEVLDFYTMFNKSPVGKHHIQICGNISCSMAGGRELIEHLCKKFGVQVGEVTKDGKFCVSRAECLGSCDTAPVMQINIDPYHENLTVEKLDQIVSQLSNGSR